MPTKRLTRSIDEKMIAGVCGGIAEYFGIDPTIVRVIFVALLFTTFGFWAYLILWIVMPVENLNKPDKPDIIDSQPE